MIRQVSPLPMVSMVLPERMPLTSLRCRSCEVSRSLRGMSQWYTPFFT